jgi:predicted metal-dependent hydrolase
MGRDADRPPGEPLPVRAMRFELAPIPLVWNPAMPELAVAANSISLLMPYVEPFIVRSIRATLPALDEPLRERTEAFLRQELSHQVQHRRFNDVLAAQCTGIPRFERWIARAYGWIERSRSPRFTVAFAAGSETIAFGIARWVEIHMATIFDGADPEATRLFVWHLAEEVEHKTAAYDAFEATDGSRVRYTAATALSLALLVVFTLVGSLVMLRSLRRLHRPATWFRLIRWSVSLAFSLLPTVVVSCLPSHHPRDLADPLYLTQWLRGAGRGR